MPLMAICRTINIVLNTLFQSRSLKESAESGFKLCHCPRPVADPVFGDCRKLSKGLGKTFGLENGIISKAPGSRLNMGNLTPNPARDRAQNSPVFSDDQPGLKIGLPKEAALALQEP